MDNSFQSAIQNYRQSSGTIAQSLLQGTVGQIESQQEMSETKAQILSAADNSDQQTNVAVNMSDTLDKLGLDLATKEIGGKVLPWVAKKIAGKVVSMNSARAAREAQRLGARPQQSRFFDRRNPASGDDPVNTGQGAGGDAGGTTVRNTPLRPSNPGKAPAKASGDDDVGDDAGFGSSDINIAATRSTLGDTLQSARGGLTDVAANVRAAMGGADSSLGLIPGTTSQNIGKLFSRNFGATSDAGQAAARAARAYNTATPGQLRFRAPRPQAQAEAEAPGANNPFGGDGGPVSLRSGRYTSGQGVSRLPGGAPDSQPTALTRTDPGSGVGDDAAAAARRAAEETSAQVESSTGSEALSLVGRTIGAVADLLGPAAAIYGIIEAGHGLYEDAKLQSDSAFKQANTVIAQAQQQQAGLSADISADQFASKVGAARPSFGSLAAPSMDTSQQMMPSGGGQF